MLINALRSCPLICSLFCSLVWASLFAACVVSTAPVQAADSWPGFRGPGARGIAADDSRLPMTWSSRKNVQWVAELEGRGWSSPIVAGGRVFVTTAVSETPLEDARKGLFFGGDRTELPVEHVRWLVTCLEADSGLTRWEVQVAAGPPPGPIHVKNSLASETPVTDGHRVYVVIGNVGVFCLDAGTGDRVWEYRRIPRDMRWGWGPAASPVLHGGRVYLVNDNETDSSVVALDARTGAELWRVGRDEKSNWSTPFVWEHPLGSELVTPGTMKTRSYGLDGRLLWELAGASAITIATPYAAHGLLYVSSGFVLDRKQPIWAIKPGARGDITLAKNTTENAFIAWSLPDSAPYNPSTLVYGDELYVLSDRGLLACYDAHTGQQHYRKARLSGGRAFTASPWAYNGHIFCASEYGETFAVRAGRNFEVVALNPLGDDEMLMASPAIAAGRLFIRTDRRLYCLEQPPQPED